MTQQQREITEHTEFMREALQEAQLSLDEGEFPVGCVFVAKGEIVARGRRCNSSEVNRNEIDHAEITTLRLLIKQQNKIPMHDVSVYSTMEPCLMCYSTMLLSGIRTFVWSYEDVMGGGTNLSLTDLNPLYAAMNVQTIGAVLRKDSLALFQEFFKEHSYWQDSLLSKYTLEQSV
ncbi:MAG: nucleoside deaminase [Desulfobulbaceae bacterium]|nr:nucleoside deaminase [Desulfobulbaceae bacterium]